MPSSSIRPALSAAGSRRALALSGVPAAGKSLASAAEVARPASDVRQRPPIRTVPRAALEALVGRLTAPGSGHNTRALQHRIAADARRGLMPVRILKVYGGGLDGMPTADVQPLTKQVDGLGNPTSHGPIYSVAVGRPHSGAGAFIADPKPGDVHALMPADRDWSTLRSNGWQESPPASDRRSSLSDGVLLHALTGKPTQGTYCKPDGGLLHFDQFGGSVETFPDKRMVVNPADGGVVYLGDPSKGGTFDWVMTASGPSSVAKAKL